MLRFADELTLSAGPRVYEMSDGDLQSLKAWQE
jgi:hypothetical protein